MGFIFPDPQSTYNAADPSGEPGWSSWEWWPTLTTATQWGSATQTSAGTTAAVASTATALQGRSFATTTSVNAVASIVLEAVYNISYINQALFSFSLDATTNRRVWVGWADVIPATMAGSATPTANYFAFRYDTGAGDTTWRAMTDNNSGTPTHNTATGIAPVTTPTNLAIMVNSATSVDFWINNQKYVNFGATLPATSVVTLRPFISITNLTAGTARSFTAYFMSGRMRVI